MSVKGFGRHKNGKAHPVHGKKGVDEKSFSVTEKGMNDKIEVKIDSIPNNSTTKLTAMQKDIEKKLQNQESILTEKEVNYIKSSLNNSFQGSGNDNSFGRKLNEMIWNNEEHFRLTPEQNQKGLEFLKKYAKKEGWGENSYRENHVLQNFKEFRLEGFKDDANYTQAQYGMHNFVPVYLVIAKDGSTFQYYYNRGEVSITG